MLGFFLYKYLDSWPYYYLANRIDTIKEFKDLYQAEKGVAYLWDNDLSSTGLKALAQSTFLGNLEELDLYGNHIGPDGIEALAESSALKNLKFLSLKKNIIQK